MKKCPWCGQQYPDEVSACTTDQSPLESCDLLPVPEVSESKDSEDHRIEPEAPSQEVEEVDIPEGFRPLGAVDAFEADRLLKRFSETEIRFQIERIERRERSGRGGYRTNSYIEIFVHADDYEKALEILRADWKV